MWLILAVAALVGAVWRYVAFGRVTFKDSFWYIRNTLIGLGESKADAAQTAADWSCNTGTPDRCDHLPGPTDAYISIFEARVGIPILARPFVGIWGEQGLMVFWVGTAVITALLLVWVVLTIARGRLVLWQEATVGLATIAALVFLPIGYWIVRVMSEGPSITGLVLVAALVTAGLYRQTWPIWPLSLAILLAVLVSSAVRAAVTLPLAAGLVGSLVLISIVRPHIRLRSLVMAGALFIGAASWYVYSILAGHPTVTDSLQDTFTNHYHRPPVSDPWYQLFGLLKQRLREFSTEAFEPPAIFLLMTIALGVGYLIWRLRWSALIWLSVGLSGPIAWVLHPFTGRIGLRLTVTVWVPVVIAVSILVADLLLRRRWFADIPKGSQPSEPEQLSSTPTQPTGSQQ